MLAPERKVGESRQRGAALEFLKTLGRLELIGTVDQVGVHEEQHASLLPQGCELGQHQRHSETAKGVAVSRLALAEKFLDLVESDDCLV
jgi:hypothetical protein